MDAPNISNPQTELEKFILEMDKRGVQVIYNMNLGAMAGAAYISSAEYLPPEETTISQVFRKKGQQDYVDQNRMIQLPLLSIKDRNLLSTGVAHELRHLENNERQTRKEEFAFYGHLLSPLGSPFAKDKDLVQLRTADASTAIYSKFLSMDELDTFSHFYSDLLKVIENPESKSYQIEDYKLLAHLNSFSKTGLGVSIIAQKLADYINDKMKEQKEGSKENSSIRFFYDDRYDFYWLEYIDILNSKLFIFNLPIVKSQKGSSREVLLIMISDQMKLLKEYAIAKEKLFRAALDIDKHVDLESRCSRQQIISGLSLLSDANVHSDTFFTNSSDLFVTEGATPCD